MGRNGTLVDNNNQFVNIGTRRPKGKSGRFQREFLFTGIKADTITMANIPVVWLNAGQTDTVWAGNNTIRFSNEKVPAALSDIKGIVQPPLVYSPYLRVVGLGVIALVVLFFVLKSLTKTIKKNRISSVRVIRKVCLKKIQLIEEHIKAKSYSINQLGGEQPEFFYEYLIVTGMASGSNNGVVPGENHIQLSAVSDSSRANDILKDVNKLRFAMHPDGESLQASLDQIRNFISGQAAPISASRL